MKKTKVDPNAEIDPIAVRNALVDSLIGSSFRLSATGSVFTIGTECNPTWADILFCLNRLYTCGYVDEFKLLPYNVEPAILVSGLSKDTVAWLVPILINAVDRKVLGGQIDILSPNNHTLVRLMDVLGWYWHRTLHGPKPVIAATIKLQKPILVVQDAALVCPMCYHQFKPPKNLVTQQAKAWAYAKWFPTHLEEYHRWAKPGSKKSGSKSNKKGGTKK